ncbi:hypothetical protein A3197_20910 [Candidatus Thiodiazotropha endoloripes]|nr:hypothetical protein A3197_20910 [Candidatus Thiodiazotropha endoloripes]
MKKNAQLFLLLCVLCVNGIPDLYGEEAFLVGFAQDTLANDWRLAQVMEVKREFERHPNIKFIYTDGKGDTALQVLHIEELVSRGVDLLMVSPREKSALTDIITKVYSKNIPVVLLDRGIDGDGFTTFIHPDNRRIARAAAEYLLKVLNNRGHILMLVGVPGATPTIHRSDSFTEIMAQHPAITITPIVGNYLRADTMLALEQLLEKGLSFDAIYAQSDSMAAGARMVLRKHGIEPSSIPIIGIDYIREAQQAIRDGDQSISFTYPTGGKEGAYIANQILSGKEVPKEIILESIKVTRENADMVPPIF